MFLVLCIEFVLSATEVGGMSIFLQLNDFTQRMEILSSTDLFNCQKYSLNFVVVLVQNAQVTFCLEILPLLASCSILNVVSHLKPVCFLSGFGLI